METNRQVLGSAEKFKPTRGYLFFIERINSKTGEKEREMAFQHNTTIADLDNALASGAIKDEVRYKEIFKNLAEYNEGILQKMAEKGEDALTGLPTKPGPTLSKFLDQLERNPRMKAVGVAYMDLDSFKSINDKYGHEAGDDILKMFATRIEQNTKGLKDFVFRLHGDEFLVILPMESDEEISNETAEGVLERLRSQINTDFRVEVRPGEFVELSASMGFRIVRAGDSRNTPEGITADADAQMYEDKRRNSNKK